MKKLKKIVDARYIVENSLVPFEISNGTLKIAIPDASKLSLMKNLKTITKMDPELYAASISDINDFIIRLVGEDTAETKKVDSKKIKLVQVKKKERDLVEVGSEVIVFGEKIISEAIDLGASDIHIEAFRNTANIRFRIDGILKTMEEHTKFLKENYNAVVTRIKIISKLDIAERRMPQDGASTFKHGDKEVDLEYQSCLPRITKEL